MDDILRKDFILLFNQRFEEIVLPQIAELSDDVKDLKVDVKSLKHDEG